ncbi:MAG: N-terminal phage integrase SAM-like domain-containing protein [Evtepia gabavorous]
MWYELYAKPNVRTATANRYQLIIDTYTVPCIGNIKLKKMTTRHLQKLYKELLENGRSMLERTRAKGSAPPRSAAST